MVGSMTRRAHRFQQPEALAVSQGDFDLPPGRGHRHPGKALAQRRNRFAVIEVVMGQRDTSQAMARIYLLGE